LAQPFDEGRLELTGEPQLLGPANQFSISQSGVLATQAVVSLTGMMAWYDRAGKVRQSLPLERVASIDVSPDGERLAMTRGGSGGSDLWLRETKRGAETRFTVSPGNDTIALWSPDGSRIVFNSSRDGNASLYEKPSNGSTAEQLLLKLDHQVWGNDWSRDGRFVLFAEGLSPNMDLGVLSMDGSKETRKPVAYLREPFNQKQGQFSPDGRFVAYASDESGKYEIYVRPFPDASAGKWTVSSGGGVEPRWSPDGRELFYVSGKKIMAVDVKTTTTFSLGAPKELFEAPIQPGYTNDQHRWQVTPDGKQFLLFTYPENRSTPITVTVNWQQLLKQK
jgi:Tol biopolymer transport system component